MAKGSLRATGSTTLMLGLVSVPVKIYAATSDPPDAIKFNQLHASCAARVRQQLVCEKCEAVVEKDQIVKGYEHDKGKFVTFTADEIKALAVESETTEIVEYVFEKSVPGIYLDKHYYLAPDKGGSVSYALLVGALMKTGREAIAKYTSRGKQYVVLIRPEDGSLVMSTLRYADEVRSMDLVPMNDLPTVAEASLELACKIVEQQVASTFDASRFTDEARARVQRAVDAKVVTGNLHVEEPKAKGQVVDIMEALRASLRVS